MFYMVTLDRTNVLNNHVVVVIISIIARHTSKPCPGNMGIPFRNPIRPSPLDAISKLRQNKQNQITNHKSHE